MLRHWPAILCGALGFAMAFYPTLSSGFALMQHDPGDTRLNNYVLEHGWLWLGSHRLHEHFWDPPIFYPAHGTGAYTDILIGAAPIYWALRLAGLAPDTSFQLFVMVVSALNFAAMYGLLSGVLKLRPLAGALGAFLFAFGASRTAQLGHPQLFPQFFTVAALAALLRLFEEPADERHAARRWIWIPVACASLTLQLYAGFYLGYMALLALALAGAFVLLMPALRRRALAVLREHLRALALSVAASGLALAPMALRYTAAAHALGQRAWWEVAPNIAWPQSWLYMGGSSWLYGWLDRLPSIGRIRDAGEHAIGVGLVTSALAVLGLLRARRSPLGAVLLAVAVGLAVMATGVHRPELAGASGTISPWAVVFRWVPGAAALRAVTRIALVVLIPASIGLAFALDALARSRRCWLAPALMAACLAEQGRSQRAFDKLALRKDVSAIAARVDPRARAFLVSPTDPRGPAVVVHLDAMWAEMECGVPTVNGYSGNVPPGYELELSDACIATDADARRVRAALDRWCGGLDGVCLILAR